MRRIALRLIDAMRAAGHDVADIDVADIEPVCGVEARCAVCGAAYRSYPGEALARIWPCSLHQHRNHKGTR